MKKVIDAGHYYLAKGPTVWTRIGWDVGRKISSSNDKMMLFIDDVHSLEMMHPMESCADNIFDYCPAFDLQVRESEIFKESYEVLDSLKCLSKKKKAKMRRNGQWYCSGFPLTKSNGDPLCALLDGGLTLHKYRMGFRAGINVLPFFYEPQQAHLLRIVKKAIPKFELRVFLFDDRGRYWEL